MHFGSLSSSLFGLLTGLGSASDASPTAPAPTGVSFADALGSALMVVAPPEMAAAVEGPEPSGPPSLRDEDPAATDPPVSQLWGPVAHQEQAGVRLSLLGEDRPTESGGIEVRPVSAPGAPPADVPARNGMADSTVAAAAPTPGVIESIPETAVILAEAGSEGSGRPTPSVAVGESILELISPETGAPVAAATGPTAIEVLDRGSFPPTSTETQESAAVSHPAAPNPAAPIESIPLPPSPAGDDEASPPDARTTNREPAPTPSQTNPATDPMRRLSNLIFPREVEVHVDRDSRPTLSAATLVRDLGQTLASRPPSAPAPVNPAAPLSSIPPTPVLSPSPLANAVSAMAPVVESEGTVVSTEVATSVAPSAPPPTDTPVDRDTPLRRELPAPTETVPAVGQNGSGAETGQQDSATTHHDSLPADPAPPTAPAGAPDAAPPTPAPSSAIPNDLQMQARQAVARTVVRMGEDQLLASARPTGVRVQLSPSHLGQIQIEVSQNPQRGIDVTIHAAVEETQRALEADADDMLDSLRSQKLDVARVSVRSEGDRSESDPRQRNDLFRNRDQSSRGGSPGTEGEGGSAQDRGGHSRGGQQPPFADPTDYRYWEAIR